MLFDDLLNNPAKWMVESRDEHDIVLTSRIRLAPFPAGPHASRGRKR